MLGQPFIPFLELLRIPEAAAASETIVVGFADMFLPSILASGIESDLTSLCYRGNVGVTQLIYMSEIGALLIGSKIPVKPWELFMIFILRTLVTLPVDRNDGAHLLLIANTIQKQQKPAHSSLAFLCPQPVAQ